ncbi:MAG TPA: serine hydrolase domain-containing protein [Acidimicrobiales bacterium]
MSTDSLVDGWLGTPSVVVLRLDNGVPIRVAEAGDLEVVRPWASISKMVVAMAFGVESDWDLHSFEERRGPRGATLANLLSHSSGLGLEEGDPVVDVGTQRIYSNYGVDLAVASVVGEHSAEHWLQQRVCRGLGMNDTHLVDRPSSSVEGSTDDLVTFATAWLRSDGISQQVRDYMITPYAPQLGGFVPGFGRFTPCPWGLGPEVRGAKQHWMGDWPPSSFGHFGKSGSMLLLNADEQIGLVATSTEPFGGWATMLWPQWTSAMRQLALGS